jgi:hypothetical protein
MALGDWSSTAASNTSVGGVNIAEGCPAAGVNNALRAIMADVAGGINLSTLATFLASSSLANARTALGVSEGTTSSNNFAALSNTANSAPLMTGADAWTTYTVSTFARTLLDDGDAATARDTLDALGLTSATFGANTIDLRLTLGNGDTLCIVGGSGTLAGNSTTTVSFGVTFNPAPVAIVNGGSTNISNEGDVHNAGAATTTGISIANSAPSSDGYTWLAIGKLA